MGMKCAAPQEQRSIERIIALLSILDESGFVAWARERRGWLFDQLHRARNPGKTASKRMARLLEKASVRGAARGSIRSGTRTRIGCGG